MVAAVSKPTLVDQLDVISRNASGDKQLTLARLKCVNVAGDRNCLFRSLSVYLYNHEDRHSELRSQIVHHMSVNYSAIFPDFCNKSTDTDKNLIDQKQLQKLKAKLLTNSEWDGEDVIKAAASYLQRDIKVFILAVESAPLIYTAPSSIGVQTPVCCLAFYEPGHYRAVIENVSAQPLNQHDKASQQGNCKPPIGHVVHHP